MAFEISARPTLARTAVLLLALAACDSGPTVEPADLVLTNGKIVTVDDAVPEAAAVAMRGAEIVAVGSVAEIEEYIGPETEVIDLAGPTTNILMRLARLQYRLLTNHPITLYFALVKTGIKNFPLSFQKLNRKLAIIFDSNTVGKHIVILTWTRV
jgi:hypothetical protein